MEFVFDHIPSRGAGRRWGMVGSTATHTQFDKREGSADWQTPPRRACDAFVHPSISRLLTLLADAEEVLTGRLRDVVSAMLSRIDLLIRWARRTR